MALRPTGSKIGASRLLYFACWLLHNRKKVLKDTDNKKGLFMGITNWTGNTEPLIKENTNIDELKDN